MMFLSNEIIGFFNKIIWIWFFRSYPSETDERTSKFIKLKKIFLFLKIAVPLAISTLCAFYIFPVDQPSLQIFRFFT